MTTDPDTNQLLNDFKQYLEEQKLAQPNAYDQPDLHSLLTEMASLKTEVKAESRQFKNTLESLSSALGSIQDDNKSLSAALALQAEQFRQQQTEITRNLLLGIVDIYDRFHTSLGVLQLYRPLTGLFKKSKARDVHFIERFSEGQAMTAQRFEQLLLRYQVRAIPCLGKTLDPQLMTAVETGHDPQQANGIVLEELRSGFLYQDQVLRLAEVKVNKIR